MSYKLLMEGRKANLVVTDPPYSVGYCAKAGIIKNDNLSDGDFYKFLLAFYKNTFEAMDN
jgi:DNA modification methylase